MTRPHAAYYCCRPILDSLVAASSPATRFGPFRYSITITTYCLCTSKNAQTAHSQGNTNDDNITSEDLPTHQSLPMHIFSSRPRCNRYDLHLLCAQTTMVPHAQPSKAKVLQAKRSSTGCGSKTSSVPHMIPDPSFCRSHDNEETTISQPANKRAPP